MTHQRKSVYAYLIPPIENKKNSAIYSIDLNKLAYHSKKR